MIIKIILAASVVMNVIAILFWPWSINTNSTQNKPPTMYNVQTVDGRTFQCSLIRREYDGFISAVDIGHLCILNDGFTRILIKSEIKNVEVAKN